MGVFELVPVFVQYFLCFVVEIYFDGLRVVFYGLVRDIMYVYAAGVRADAVFVQAIEVADTAAGETLEDEYVSLSFKHGCSG